MIDRRALLVLAAAAFARPRIARAQPSSLPVIGFLGEAALEPTDARLAALRQGLAEIGYAEGRDVAFDWRMAERQPNRLPGLAASLVSRHVALLIAAGDAATAAAAAATTTIPIVFVNSGEPRKRGTAAPPERPRTNVTGVSWSGADLALARLGLLRQLVPKATTLGLLIDAEGADAVAAQVATTAETAGLRLTVLHVGSAAEIDAAFATLAAQEVGGLVVGGSDFFAAARAQLIELSARHGIPTIYGAHEIATDGGLAAYGYSVSDAFRRAGVYAGWILQGAKPADLPVLQSTKIEFTLNLKTAAALGLEVPANLRDGADATIQ